MIKSNLKSDKDIVDKYIKEAKDKYPNSNISIININDYMIMKEEESNCEKCYALANCLNANKGYLTQYINNEFVLTPCKYLKKFKDDNNKKSIIKTLYMPESIKNAKLEDYDINSESRKKIYNYLINFINEYKNNNILQGLYLYGSFSRGKTFTLACLSNELAKYNIKSLLIYFPDLAVDLKLSLGSSKFDELLNMLKSIDVLMLDDLGSENMSAWLRDDILGPIINYRLMDNKPVFISSNISPSDLKRHFIVSKGEDELKANRIIDRLSNLTKSISMDDCNIYYKHK